MKKEWKLVSKNPENNQVVEVNAANDVGRYSDDFGNVMYLILEKENNRGWTFAAYRKCSVTVVFFFARGDYWKIPKED